MKKKLLLVLFGLVVYSAFLNAQSLDEAVINAAVKISRELPANAKAAIINFQSDSEKINSYVINELYGAILRNRRIVPFISDQTQLQNIRGDLPSNTTDTISRESAQRIGRLLGAQYLITGSIKRAGSEYKIDFTVFSADNAEIKSRYSDNVIIDNNFFASLPDSSTPVKNDAEPVKQEQVSATAPDSTKKTDEKESALLASVGIGGLNLRVKSGDFIDDFYRETLDLSILFIGKSGFTISTGASFFYEYEATYTNFIFGVGYIYYNTFYIGGLLHISTLYLGVFDQGPTLVPTVVFGHDFGGLLIGGQVSYVYDIFGNIDGFRYSLLIGVNVLNGRN